MTNYTVKKLNEDVIIFKKDRKIKATVARMYNGTYQTATAPHGNSRFVWKYDNKKRAIDTAVEYLTSLDFDENATFNETTPDFIYDL